MSFIDQTLAVGIVMMDKEGYDEMAVIHGTIRQRENGLFLESEGQEPFEMSEKWLEKLKPTEEAMGPRFQGSKYCLIIASLTKPAS